MKFIHSLLFLTILANISSGLSGMTTVPYDPFMMACKFDHWDAANTILCSHPNTNIHQCDEGGLTPLHLAICSVDNPKYSQRLRAIELLLEAGAQVDSLDKEGLTPLATAILLAQNKDIVKILLGNGANPDFRSSHPTFNLSARQLAKAAIEPSANYNLETMLMSKEIYDEIENFSSLKNAPSLLSPTAASPSSMMVQEIPVNTADSKSSLIVSAQSIPTTASMVKYQEEDLLDPEPLYGPYYSKGPIYTRKELMNALNKGELIPDTMYADDDIPPIITAAVYHDKEVIECLIKNGLTYIDEADEVNETALHKAARAGNLDLANYLIEKKLCLESKDFKGNTPLMTAIQFNHMAIIELFFNNNADITGKNKKKESVLVQAINAGNPAVVDLLITGNVPSSRKVNGFTPLEFAQEKCNQLPMHELISETGKNLKSIICSLTRYAKEKSDTAFAKLEAEEDSIVQKKARKQLTQQIAQTEKALLPTRAQLFPILAIRCKLALNKTATQDSSHYMNSQDKPFKILLIIAKQLGLEEEKPTLKLLKAPSSVQPSALKASMSNTKKTKKTLQTIIK